MNNLMQDFFLRLAEWEKPVFFFLNKVIKNRFLDVSFSLITKLAEPTYIVLICLLLFVLGKYKGKMVSVFILFASYITYVTSLAIKEVIKRPRPMDAYQELSVMGSVKFFSFPSTHSALIAVIATILCVKYKKLGFVLIPAALLVGVSRVYLGHHFPTDVLAGFVLGVIIALLLLGAEGLFVTIQKQ